MTTLDTLIRLDTLTLLPSAGSNRQKISKEVKIQHVYKKGCLGNGEEVA